MGIGILIIVAATIAFAVWILVNFTNALMWILYAMSLIILAMIFLVLLTFIVSKLVIVVLGFPRHIKRFWNENGATNE